MELAQVGLITRSSSPFSRSNLKKRCVGVGWNFLFLSSTSLITSTYSGEGEKTRVQSANDFLIFATMIVASFSAGPLEASIGWHELNRTALMVTGGVASALLVLAWRERLCERRSA